MYVSSTLQTGGREDNDVPTTPNIRDENEEDARQTEKRFTQLTRQKKKSSLGKKI